MLDSVIHCTQCISANTRPHQLWWVDQKTHGTAISHKKDSQVAGLIHIWYNTRLMYMICN